MTTSNRSSTTSSLEPRWRGLLDGTWATFISSGASLLRGRRGLALALLGALPLLPVVLSLAHGDGSLKGVLGFAEVVSKFYFRLVNLVVCLFLGCAALGDDIEGKTLSYLLTRALPRSALVLGRFLAYWAAAAGLLAASVSVAYGLTVSQMGVRAFLTGLPTLGWFLLAQTIAAGCYGAFFVLLSVIFRRPLLVGLVLVFLWENLASAGPVAIADYTILHHVYVLLLYWTGLPRLLDFSGLSAEEVQTAGRALGVLLGFGGSCLLLAMLRFRSKEYGGE